MKKHFTAIESELTATIEKAKASLAQFAMDEDWERSKKVAEIAKELTKLLGESAALERRLGSELAKLENVTRAHTKGAQSKLWILIHWGQLPTHIKVDELILDDKAADSLVYFIEQMVKAYGEYIFPKIAEIKNGASPLISEYPGKDFVNPKTGAQYSYRRIRKTSWSVKTHCDTAQKMEQISKIKTLLGMPSDAVEVKIVDKNYSET